MTFQAWQRSRRIGSALDELREGADATGVGYDHGFESTSGFRDAFQRLIGAPPGRGRTTAPVLIDLVETPVGVFVAGTTDDGLCLFEFADRGCLEAQVDGMRRHLGRPVLAGTNVHHEQLREELDAYFAGSLHRFRVPLVLSGTPFQESVWRGLLEIPYGDTCSYEQLARTIGRPGAQRAVGRANGQNRIPIVIPCHRVVRSDGQLGGYGGGLWRKRFLLVLERGGVQEPKAKSRKQTAESRKLKAVHT